MKKKEFLEEVRKVIYQQEVPLEICGRVFFECIGRLLHLTPTVIYTKESFLQAIREKIANQNQQKTEVWSVSE